MTKNNKKGTFKAVLKKVKTISAIISVFLMVELLFDPIALASNLMEQRRIQNDLAHARTLWQTKGLESYTIKVRGQVPAGCIYDAILTVQNGQLVSVQARKSFNEKVKFATVKKEQWSRGLCNYSQIGIPQAFSQVNEFLDNLQPFYQRLRIKFDPTYGFITYYQFGYNSVGLLTTFSLRNCCVWYEFSDFQPIQ
jgi:hypothetical protein